MALNSIGDLAQTFALRQQSNQLKTQMARLTEELSSGVASDVARHLSGNFSHLADVNHKLALLDSHRVAADRGRIETGVMQTALDQMTREAGELSSTALTIATSAGAPSFNALATEARNALGTMLSALNVSVGGRSLFAGDDVTSRAIAPPDVLLTEIRAAAAGAASAADVSAAMDAFFDTPGGGFETLIYQGSTAARASYPLGEGESVTLDLRADDAAFRAILKQTSIAALLDDTGITLDGAAQAQLARDVGAGLLNGHNRVTAIQADLGFAESRIDRATSRISAEISALSMVQSETLTIDPYDTAVELETVRVRLESIYTLTSRMSRLSLVNFLS